MQAQGIEFADWAERIIELNTRLEFWKVLQGGRVVYQCNEFRMEVNLAVGTISEPPKREAENFGGGRGLSAEAGVFVPGSTEFNAKGNEKGEGVHARRKEKEEDARGRPESDNREKLLQAKRNYGERKLRNLQKEANRLDGKIRAKKGESETMQNRTPPSKFLAGTMEWLKNEVRHWSRIVDLLKQ